MKEAGVEYTIGLGYRSSVSGGRADRVVRFGSQGDTSIVGKVIRYLDSPDVGERVLAHEVEQALFEAKWNRRHDFGYRAWAPRRERLERIAEIELFWRTHRGAGVGR